MRFTLGVGVLCALFVTVACERLPSEHETAEDLRGAGSPREALREWTQRIRGAQYVSAARLLPEAFRDEWISAYLMTVHHLSQIGPDALPPELDHLAEGARSLVDRIRANYQIDPTDFAWLGFVDTRDPIKAISEGLASVPDRDQLFADLFSFVLAEGIIEHLPLGEPDLLLARDDSATAYFDGFPHRLTRSDGRWYLRIHLSRSYRTTTTTTTRSTPLPEPSSSEEYPEEYSEED